MNNQITSLTDPRENIIEGDGKPSQRLQTYMEEIEEKLNTFLLGEAVMLPSYTVATLPDATKYEGGTLYVSDEAGGAIPAFSDGISWKKYDRSAVL